MTTLPPALRDLLTGHQSTQSLKLLPQPTNLTPAWATFLLFGAFLEPGEPLGAVAGVVRTVRIRSVRVSGPTTSLATVPPSVGRSSSIHDA